MYQIFAIHQYKQGVFDMKKIYLAMILMVLSSSVFADCYLDGVLYPTGTVVSGLTCQADGSWR